ncbi:MAG: bifunctional riboflavin kinase/FAD synthetase [Tissierellia bacterium]|nr:bifunctional riboflavin kinase/FAD synthetase [Tissierellia bacterium]
MEIFDLLEYKEERFNTAIALGNFDGLHLGHRKLINAMVSRSREIGVKPSLLLFKNHTKTTINKNKPKIITNNEQKFRIAEELGIEIIYLIDFDENIMKLSGEEFVTNIILEKMNSKLVTVGFDYRFGYKASGDSNYLIELGKKYDFDVIVVEPVYVDNKVVSSSSIRELISVGKIEETTKKLGRPYSFLGKVIPGSNRGNKLGFPTANIELIDNYVVPKTGVYVTNTIIDNKRYISATNIGYNPTFNENVLKIETHILDFEDKIYGKIIEIEFLEFMRDDIKFDDPEDLIDQMRLDIELIKNRY